MSELKSRRKAVGPTIGHHIPHRLHADQTRMPKEPPDTQWACFPKGPPAIPRWATRWLLRSAHHLLEGPLPTRGVTLATHVSTYTKFRKFHKNAQCLLSMMNIIRCHGLKTRTRASTWHGLSRAKSHLF